MDIENDTRGGPFRLSAYVVDVHDRLSRNANVVVLQQGKDTTSQTSEGKRKNAPSKRLTIMPAFRA
jgi:hypothetical protein